MLVLRFYLGLSDAEIARDMGIRQGTVRSTAHRALAALGRHELDARTVQDIGLEVWRGPLGARAEVGRTGLERSNSLI